MKIRQAKPADLDQIVAIEWENFSKEEAIPTDVFKAHLETIKTSFLVAEKDGEILGYIEGPVRPERYLVDQSFSVAIRDHSHEEGGFISLTCLSISPKAQSLGLGKKLIGAIKEVAVRDKREGVNLTCHDYLVPYYEKHGFINEGKSKSKFAGEEWYDMVWQP
ncbi:putative arylalkylamine n-acetyltransferase [Streptococcus oralis]|uniref:Putative arylalkylamine n-acetyltransferase n=1 Tax=Streptococcus oralis TaxID=1303 RepID=A0A139RKY4_STROR|nr:GNAT family N-acetyltransferase [Streptococcus oralis]KXU15423.1 putative arylalkylamine n-acetyltransferase [Streptococcus oralis]